MVWGGSLVWDDSDKQDDEESGVTERGDLEELVDESENTEYNNDD